METVVGLALLVGVFGLATLPIVIFRKFQKNKPVKSKEERREETIMAIVIILILTVLAIAREIFFDNRTDEILKGSNSSQYIID